MSSLNASSVGLIYASDAQNSLLIQTNSTTAIGIDTLQNITIGSSTVSTQSSNGALVVAGGAGISGNVNVGGNLTATGTLNVGTITQNGQPLNVTVLLYALAF